MTQIPSCLRGIDWHIVRDVCVFTEHNLGKEVFDEARIGRMIDTINHKTYSLGRPPSLTDDHISAIDEHGKVTVRPSSDFTIYGYAVGHRKRKRKVDDKEVTDMMADWLLYPEHVAEVSKRPHRSIEWLKDATGEFYDPCAITKQTPRLELGVILPVDYYSGKVPSNRRGDSVIPHAIAYTLQGGRVLYTWREGSDMTPEMKVLTEIGVLIASLKTPAPENKAIVPEKVTYTNDRTDKEKALEEENKKLKEDLLKSTMSALQTERYTIVRALEGVDADTFMKRWGESSKETFDNAVAQVKEVYSLGRDNGIIPLHKKSVGSGMQPEQLLDTAARVVERIVRDGGRADTFEIATRIQNGESPDSIK